MKSKKQISNLNKRVQEVVLKEDFFDRWIDKIFSKAKAGRIKNDPDAQSLKRKMDNAFDVWYKEALKKYGSPANFPLWIKQSFQDAGYKL